MNSSAKSNSKQSWKLNLWPVALVASHLSVVSQPKIYHTKPLWGLVMWCAFLAGIGLSLFTGFTMKWLIPWIDIGCVALYVIFRLWWKIPYAFRLLHAKTTADKDFGQMVLWMITVLTGAFILGRILFWIIQILFLSQPS